MKLFVSSTVFAETFAYNSRLIQVIAGKSFHEASAGTSYSLD